MKKIVGEEMKEKPKREDDKKRRRADALGEKLNTGEGKNIYMKTSNYKYK